MKRAETSMTLSLRLGLVEVDLESFIALLVAGDTVVVKPRRCKGLVVVDQIVGGNFLLGRFGFSYLLLLSSSSFC